MKMKRKLNITHLIKQEKKNKTKIKNDFDNVFKHTYTLFECIKMGKFKPNDDDDKRITFKVNTETAVNSNPAILYMYFTI